MESIKDSEKAKILFCSMHEPPSPSPQLKKWPIKKNGKMISNCLIFFTMTLIFMERSWHVFFRHAISFLSVIKVDIFIKTLIGWTQMHILLHPIWSWRILLVRTAYITMSFFLDVILHILVYLSKYCQIQARQIQHCNLFLCNMLWI